jgi:NAD-dependent dihydropyrimidine dehydrogenase PreA subunit
MPYVITDACQKDFLCAPECATNAIHPGKDEPGAETVPQLYINPDDCVECGSCVSICPTGAIFPIEELPAEKAEFAAKNAAYFN